MIEEKISRPPVGKLRVGIITVATGNYIRYIRDFRKSVLAHFLAGASRTVFVITDRPCGGSNLVRLPTEAKKWPFGTLLRFEMMWQNRALLSEFDALFYIDADMKVVSEIGTEVFGPKQAWMTGVIHPSFSRSGEESFERNEESRAFVTPEKRKTYFQGCFFGGDSESFLGMCEVLRHRVDEDLAKGIIAKWWDEGHLNWFFSEHPPHTVSSAYAYPEGWNLPFEPKIIHLAKDHERMRALPRKSMLGRLVSVFTRWPSAGSGSD